MKPQFDRWFPVPKHFPHQVGVPVEHVEDCYKWLGEQKFRYMRDFIDIVVPMNGLKFLVFRDAKKAAFCMLTWGKTSKARYDRP